MNEYLVKEEFRNMGTRKVYKFENGYGASVVSNPYSYGGEKGLWELAVLDKDNNLTYSTTITNDVIGYLTFEDVEEILKQIKELKK